MKRREWLAGFAAASLPTVVRAQPASLPRIAYVSGRSLGTDAHLLAAFREGLKSQGFIDGQNVVLDVRWLDGDFSKLPAVLQELIALKPQLIAAVGANPVAVAAKQATSTLPVVFSVGGDPVQLGLVNDIARPDGNLTGITLLASELDVKRLELLRDMVPRARKVALLSNSSNSAAVNEQARMEAAAAKLGLQMETLDVRSTSDIDRAFDKLPPGSVDALAVVGDAFLISRRDKIVGLAAQRRLPAIYPAREFADNGGLMSYGTRWTDLYVIVGTYAGRIMRGARPAELPVQRPNRYELVVNLRTARALGLAPTQVVLGRADEVLD
jgi:putative ABC transport system substrate-binding protein